MWQGPVAGAVAGVLSRIVVFPSDTVKVRMQLQGTGSAPPLYNSTLHAFKTILGREGLGGFYRGFSAIAFGVIPANMTYFGGYELAKRVVPEAWGLRRDMAVGAVAQLAAGVVFTPIDVIKERMQVGDGPCFHICNTNWIIWADREVQLQRSSLAAVVSDDVAVTGRHRITARISPFLSLMLFVRLEAYWLVAVFKLYACLQKQENAAYVGQCQPAAHHSQHIPNRGIA